MNDQFVLACQGLVKSFHQGGDKIDVLNGVELTVRRGERVAILGASGTGKSTLLQILGGLDKADSGEVTIMQHRVSGLNERRRAAVRNQHLGFVYQFHHLLPEFSALDNVAMPLYLSSRSVSESKAKAERILHKVGLGHRLTHKPGQLSGGERQRAAVARALVTRPDCILADEPTGNLDEDNAMQIYQLMLELNESEGTGFVIVTHDIQLAARLDRVLVMSHGVLSEREG